MNHNESATENTQMSAPISNVTYLSVDIQESDTRGQLDYRNRPDVYRSVVTHHVMELLKESSSLCHLATF